MKEPIGNFEKLISEELEKEASQIEAEVQADKQAAGLKAPASLDEKVHIRIQQYEKERASQQSSQQSTVQSSIQNNGKNVALENESDHLIKQLSEEDQEALRLGRELQARRDQEQKSKTIRKKKRVWKQIAVLAAVLVLALAVGITSVGGPKRVVEIVRQAVGGREVTTITADSGKVKQVDNDSEEEAYQQIADDLGIEPVRIADKPKGMIFKNIEIDKDLQTAQMIYSNKERNVTYIMSCIFSDESWGSDVEDEMTDQYTYVQNETNINVREYKVLNETKNKYVAQFDFDKVHYQLTGTMNKSDFEFILRNLYFFQR